MYIFTYVGVSNLRSTRVTNATITVQWNPAISHSDCGPVLYNVTAINLGDPSNMVTMEVRQTRAEFSDLRNGSLYSISVAAVNRVGTGPISMINQTTPTDNEECM